MIQVEAAWQAYAEAVQALPAETLPLEQARGRVLAQSLHSLIDLPPFAQSAMDGYALRSTDLQSASASAPVLLACEQYIAAQAQGDQVVLAPGQCARIFTGAMLPAGADAVVMQEKTIVQGAQVRFDAPVEPYNNVRQKGEEARAGVEICTAGQLIDSAVIAAASFVGVHQVSTQRLPRVAVLVTGDELTPPGQVLRPGEVYECNGAFLRGWLAERGVVAQVSVVPDQREALALALKEALADADLVVITGGASVGERDYAREVAASVAVKERFWRVAQKPGKPLAFGMAGIKPVLIMPGNPAAVFVCAWIHLEPVLRRLMGRPDWQSYWPKARLGMAIESAPKRDRFLRVRWMLDADGGARVEGLPLQASHMLTNLIQTNALLRVPANVRFSVGDLVSFLPLTGPNQPSQ